MSKPSVAAGRYVGTSVHRSEDRRILTGAGRYVGDVRLPGMLHAGFVRSPMAHARVVGIDVETARSLPGVAAVYTGDDVEAMIVSGPDPMVARMASRHALAEFTLLATTKVRMVGDLVALVVAESRYVAEDACELVEVEYDALPPVPCAEVGLYPASTPLFDNLGGNAGSQSGHEYGPVADTFARADRVLELGIEQHRYQNVPMECRGCVASFEPASGVLTMHASTQSVHVNRSVLAKRLGLPTENVRVVAEEIGGSFGLKIGASREEVAVAAASRALGRPVKWVEDRIENLTASGQAREETFRLRAAVSDEGHLRGLDVSMLIDAGAYPALGGAIAGVVEATIPGPYRLAALSFSATAVSTNKAPYIAYRGPWASETFVRERTLDLVARELGMEPLEIRLRNVVTQSDPPPAMVTGRSLAGVTAKQSLERMAAEVDLPGFRRRQHLERARGRHLGIGYATFIEAAPGPRSPEGVTSSLGPEPIRLRLERDGTVCVFTGQMPHGQSHQTTIAQVAADTLGVRFEQVRVIVGDTALVPYGVTGGSRAATMSGGAALHGARALKQLVLEAAADLIEASAVDLDITDGEVWVRGDPGSAVSLAAVAQASVGDLEANLVYDGGAGGWSGGTHCAIVEVDTDTGRVAIERYVVVEDCGVLINPAVVDGQIRGGVAQGVGAVLLERSAYDEDANFQAATFMDYLLPTATDVPNIEIHHLETVPLDPDVNFRGVGEGGLIVAPATIVNAVEDALSPLGVRILEQYLPPARVLELIASAAPTSGAVAREFVL